MPGPWHPNTGRPGCGLVRNSWSAEEGFSSFTLLLSDPLEKGMATHSSILVWEIPWTEEPGRLQPMGSQRVRHDLATKQQQLQFLEVKPQSHTCPLLALQSQSVLPFHTHSKSSEGVCFFLLILLQCIFPILMGTTELCKEFPLADQLGA